MFLNYISVLIVSAFDAWHYLFVVLGLEIKPDFYLTIINNRIYYTLLSRFFLHKNKKKQMELRMKGKSVQCAIVLLAVGILIFGTGFFEPAREKGLAIACTNNLKQIVLGIILFSDDNSDKLPAAQDWEKKISSYVGGRKHLSAPKPITNSIISILEMARRKKK